MTEPNAIEQATDDEYLIRCYQDELGMEPTGKGNLAELVRLVARRSPKYAAALSMLLADRLEALTACQQEVGRLRKREAEWASAASYGDGSPMFTPDRLEQSIASMLSRNAELVKALEASRKVLASLLSAGHNVPFPAPEEIDAAFWAVDAALGGQSNG